MFTVDHGEALHAVTHPYRQTGSVHVKLDVVWQRITTLNNWRMCLDTWHQRVELQDSLLVCIKEWNLGGGSDEGIQV